MFCIVTKGKNKMYINKIFISSVFDFDFSHANIFLK